MRWLLVGDDGQHDETRYEEFAAAHPDNVAAVAIRQLTAGEAVLAGGRSSHDAHAEGAPWVYGARRRGARRAARGARRARRTPRLTVVPRMGDC